MREEESKGQSLCCDAHRPYQLRDRRSTPRAVRLRGSSFPAYESIVHTVDAALLSTPCAFPPCLHSTHIFCGEGRSPRLLCEADDVAPCQGRHLASACLCLLYEEREAQERHCGLWKHSKIRHPQLTACGKVPRRTIRRPVTNLSRIDSTHRRRTSGNEPCLRPTDPSPFPNITQSKVNERPFERLLPALAESSSPSWTSIPSLLSRNRCHRRRSLCPTQTTRAHAFRTFSSRMILLQHVGPSCAASCGQPWLPTSALNSSRSVRP